MNIRLSTLSAALALALVTPAAMALGLGQMQVKSGLNQPLVAEIPIISASPGELNELDVRLAAPEAFAAVGLDRPSGLSANLQFSIGKNAGGQPVVRITTASRFNDPVLSFLIEANWGKGAVTREYTALIDPPYIAPAVVRPMSAPAMVAEQMPAAPAVPTPEPTAPVTEAAAPAATPAAPAEPVYAPAPVVVAEPMPVPVTTPAPAPQPVAAAPAPKPSRLAPKPQVAASKPAPKPAAAPAPTPVPTPKPSGDYGPVAAGKTLWSIANQVRPDPSISVNQVMLALLRVNPDAFASSNINQLKRGAVLRIPSRDDIAALTPDDAAALVREQAAAWKSPHAPVPQPAESVAQPTPTPVRQVAATPAKPSARLEIVPPSGKPSSHGTQSGAAAGGGSELRAELVQTTEDLAARTAEVAELKSRVSDLEKMQADRQHMIDLQSSQLKDLQTRLQQQQAAQVAVTPAAATPATAAPEEVAAPTPLYLNPWVLGGGGLVLLGGLVFAMRRKPAPATTGAASTSARRISDDESLRASLAKTRAAVVKPLVAKTESVFVPAAPVAEAQVAVDSELDARVKAVQQNPQDIEAHLNLLRLHHARGNAIEYEAAAQAMREQVSSTLDPRWREAVIMGASLMPGHALFNQAGWNAPRFNTVEPVASVVPEVVSPPQLPVEPTTPAVSVFDAPEHDELPEAQPEPARSAAMLSPAPVEDLHLDTMHDFGHGGLDLIDAPGALADAIPGHSDIHRSESQVQEEDDASATRIELAKAYLDIGDLDGARSMLEEVLAEGGPAAQAEADRILREIG